MQELDESNGTTQKSVAQTHSVEKGLEVFFKQQRAGFTVWFIGLKNVYGIDLFTIIYRIYLKQRTRVDWKFGSGQWLPPWGVGQNAMRTNLFHTQQRQTDGGGFAPCICFGL